MQFRSCSSISKNIRLNAGIWIDPIDGTNEYIKGGTGTVSAEGIVSGIIGYISLTPIFL